MAAQPYMTTQQKRDVLSFRIVGGGPTGVEFGAELHDLIDSAWVGRDGRTGG
jgi:NADH dehydrogenase